MPAIAMSPTLSPKEVFEHYGLKPNHLAQLRYQKKGPRYIQATPRTVLYRQSDIEDWLTANTVETEDSKEIKKASAAMEAAFFRWMKSLSSVQSICPDVRISPGMQNLLLKRSVIWQRRW